MLETKIAVQAFSKLDQFLDGSLDKELKSAIIIPAVVYGLLHIVASLSKNLSWGLIILTALPLWWSYIRIAKKSTVPFKDNLWKNIGIGVASNIVVSIAQSLLLNVLEGIMDIELLGVIFWFILGFVSLFVCDVVYIKIQKKIYREKVKTDVNFKNGFASMKSNDGLSKATSTVLNKIGKFIDLPEELVSSTKPSENDIEEQVATSTTTALIPENTVQQINKPTHEAPSTAPLIEKLRELKVCLDEGLITAEEYESKKTELLQH